MIVIQVMNSYMNSYMNLYMNQGPNCSWPYEFSVIFINSYTN